jgi:hypothetical protein
LLHEGELIASSLVFSHEEQVDRLRESCPVAVDAAVVAGDPCLDRMLASTVLRGVYRQAIGVRPGQRLVFVSSTWGEESLYGRVPDIVRDLREQLPLDDFVVAVALHPNAWAAHSPWQIKMWLAACARSEVVVFPGEEGWRAGLIASDLVVGDYGSVTFYAAAIDRPVLLAVWPDQIVDPISPIGKLIREADRVDYRRPLADQISDAITRGQSPAVRAVAQLATSQPGKAAGLLRQEFYRLLDLPEPAEASRTYVVPLPQLIRRPATANAVQIEYRIDDEGVLVASATRYAAELVTAGHSLRAGTYLVVTTDEPAIDMLQLADIVVHNEPGEARTWITETLAALPGLLLASMPVTHIQHPIPIGNRIWLVGARDGRQIEFTSDSHEWSLWASLVLAWRSSGRPLEQFPARVRVTVGDVTHTATVVTR